MKSIMRPNAGLRAQRASATVGAGIRGFVSHKKGPVSSGQPRILARQAALRGDKDAECEVASTSGSNASSNRAEASAAARDVVVGSGNSGSGSGNIGTSAFAASVALLLLSEGPAWSAELAATNPFSGMTANSLYVTLALFLMSVPGIWSQIKRAPKANRKRKTFEVPGPAVEGAAPVDERARQIFAYFKSYNYKVKEAGEVITFEGIYAADRGQAAAVTFYTFFGMGSVALVLSVLVPSVGNWWYALTLLSPLAAVYYFQRGERAEEVKVKMVTSDDDRTTDIVVEGDQEEIARMARELGLQEKGMVYVKGIFEQQ